MRVLIIEGDDATGNLLRRRLWREGHVVDMAKDGVTGLEQGQDSAYHAVIIDAQLPDIDGTEVTRRIRAAGAAPPILIVAAHADPHQRIDGLDAGADDYLVGPFIFAELTARLRAITRRSPHLAPEERLTLDDLVLDRRTRVVTRAGRVLDLAPKEFALLEHLLRHPRQVLTRAMLLDHVWDSGFDPRANVVDAAIKRLRSKVDAETTQALIHTVRGVGYTIREHA